MFKVKYVDSIMMLVRLDLNLIVSLFQRKCEVSETVSTTTLIHVHAGTKFPMYKVWWLREASQIGQTFIPLCEKSSLKHSTAEFQSIQQFWLQFGHRFIAKKWKKKKKHAFVSQFQKSYSDWIEKWMDRCLSKLSVYIYSFKYIFWASSRCTIMYSVI